MDFSAAFDRVNHDALVMKLGGLGIGGPVLSIITQYLKDRKHRVCVDGKCSEWHDVASGVPQGSVLGPLLFTVYTSDLLQITNHPVFAYADDVTIVATVDDLSQRPSVNRSLNMDLRRISDWCSSWNMTLNAKKSKCLRVSRSRTSDLHLGELLVQNIPIKECTELDILGVKFDSKLTFEKHVRRIASSASQKLGLIRKANQVFKDGSISATCLRSFILPLLEYCSHNWSSSADSHLRLLDRVISSANFLCIGSGNYDLTHRRNISSVCMLFKIRANVYHPLNDMIPHPINFSRRTRLAVNTHPLCYQVPRCRTNQYQRSFIPRSTRLWNQLDSSTCSASTVQSFKFAANKLLKP